MFWHVSVHLSCPQGEYLPWPGPRYLPPCPRYLHSLPGQVRWGVPQDTYPPHPRYLPPPPQPGPQRGGGTPKYIPNKVPTPPPQPGPWWGGYPKVATPRPRTCYTAGGMPLAFTQDFLVFGYNFPRKQKWPHNNTSSGCYPTYPKFERSGGRFGERMTISVHMYRNSATPYKAMTSFDWRD